MFNHILKFAASFLFLLAVTAAAQTNGLPVIKIETRGSAVIACRQKWTDVRSFVLTDPDNSRNNVSRVDIGSRPDRIRGRGNSTWNAPKKSYRVRFRENVSLFGLAEAKNWVLLANWFDPTLGIKTSFAFELGSRLSVPHTPTHNHVELYLNGEYQGVYLLTEHRQPAPAGVEPGPGRVGVDRLEGWMVEFNFRGEKKNIEPRFKTANYSLPLVIKSPDFGNDSERGGYDIVKRDWNRLCDLMAAADFPENGYRDLIDIESFVNYFMVQIITRNHDFNHPASVFFHKDKNGKIRAGPLWDFDLSFGAGWVGTKAEFADKYYSNREAAGTAPDSRVYPTHAFFNRFFEDPVFHAKWRENWNKNFPAISSMPLFINGMANKIRESAKENYKIWRLDEQVDFDYWVEEMKNYFYARLDYLDSVYNSVEIFPASASRQQIHRGE